MKSNTCIITGGASGLGYEFAKLALYDNYDLVLVDIDKQQLIKTKKKLSALSSQKIQLIHKDLSKQNAANEIYKKVKSEKITLLINNAGFGVYGKFYETNWNLEERMIYLHIFAITQLTKLILKDMVAKNVGKILILSSLAAFQPGPLMAIYYATKSYLLSFSEALNREVKSTNVSITAFCPGPTDTNFQKNVNTSSSKNHIKLNMANGSSVANYGYKALKNKKAVAIPGFLNKILAFLPRILPRNLVTSIVLKIQTTNRSVSY